MKKSDQINEIAKALAAAQREMKAALKDSTNPFFKSTYSDLSSVWNVIREPIMSREIAILQDSITTDRGVEVTTILTHSSGQWLEFGPLCIPLGKRDAHSIGSAITYAKRYALCSAIGISSEDDDGNAAQKSVYPDKEKLIDLNEKINQQEINQLVHLMNRLPEQFKEKFWDYLKSLKFHEWSDVTKGQFPTIIKNLNRKIKELGE